MKYENFQIFDVNVENLITLETAVISSGSFTIDY